MGSRKTRLGVRVVPVIGRSGPAARIAYRKMPDEVLPKLRSLEAKAARLLPPWIAEVIFEYGADNVEADCCVNIDYDYRWATVTVFAGWTNLAPAKRWSQLRHEMIHLWLEPMAGWAKKTLELATEKGSLSRELVTKEWESRVEQSTQDLNNFFGTLGL